MEKRIRKDLLDLAKVKGITGASAKKNPKFLAQILPRILETSKDSDGDDGDDVLSAPEGGPPALRSQAQGYFFII